MKVLCVAEKPSIAKAVASHMGGGQVQTRPTGNQYVKNYVCDFDFGSPWGSCEVTMTSVLGHITAMEFPDTFRNWRHPPPESLFTAPVNTIVPEDKKKVAENITQQARYCRLLVIWTDCDREGEYIGHEIVEAARKGKSDIQVMRARFSNIERAHVLTAARRLVALDERQVQAVAARIEMDLRTGFALTRFLTINLQSMGGLLEHKILSYGSCQFPTLGFVVDRYFRVQNFTPESFWSIAVVHELKGIKANFSWNRNCLFDRMSVTILYERCLRAKTAKVTKVEEKPTRKYKPLPLTTVELQKTATRLLHMNSQKALDVAEKLYQKGFISYPRTETDRFDKGMDLRSLVQKQTQDSRWGPFAQQLVDGGFRQPREGRHDDKAHPPIHPVTFAAPSVLNAEEGRIYEYVVRRFLACCSEDATGVATNIEIQYGDEKFHTHGVVVLERNYLDVFIYENWTTSAELPKYTEGQRFEPTSALLTSGKTTAPSYLSEADLLALMDANGIGTDATMAEHIQTILLREYVAVVDGKGNQDTGGNAPAADNAGRGSRGGRGGRGRGRGGNSRGGGGTAGGRTAKYFVPTRLGVALILGFDRMNFETSLGKPFLRKEFEVKMKAICDGRVSKREVIQETIRNYQEVFTQTQEQLSVLKAACREFVFQ